MPSVEVKADHIEAKETDLTPAAKAVADRIKRAIAAAPGTRWNKTGRLLGSIKANGEQVVAAADRLKSDEVAARFADEIMPTDIDQKTHDAIAQAVYDSIKVEPAK